MRTENKSQHILSTSANLLGFSFIVLTSIKALGLSSRGVTDEITAASVLLFASSTLLSYVSMRFGTEQMRKMYENIAEAAFVLGLLACIAIALLLVLNLTQLGP